MTAEFLKHNIKVLGTPVESIKDTEDRLIICSKSSEVGLKVSKK
jgi:carbamoylphosphate synthase large subunit